MARVRSTARIRREEVIEAAIPIVARHGFATATTSQIASAAGISQPYLFRLFATKRELSAAIADRCQRRILQLIASAVAKANSGELTTPCRASDQLLGEA